MTSAPLSEEAVTRHKADIMPPLPSDEGLKVMSKKLRVKKGPEEPRRQAEARREERGERGEERGQRKEEREERDCQMRLYFVTQLEPTRMRWKGDRVHTTRLKTKKQMCKSATVSILCTIQHSPSAWAGFAPKLTETLFTPHFGPSSCAHQFLGARPRHWAT